MCQCLKCKMGITSSSLPRPCQYNEDQMSQYEWKHNKNAESYTNLRIVVVFYEGNVNVWSFIGFFNIFSQKI